MKVSTALLCMTMACSGSFMGNVSAATAPPPKLEPIPEPVASASTPATSEPDVTVSKRGGDRIEEFRFKGRLYMIRVYPAIGLPYTLVDDKGDGVFNRKDARGTPIKPAQWNVLSW